MSEYQNFTNLEINRGEDLFKNDSVFASIFNGEFCDQWFDLNHLYFQVANFFFLLSYLAPNGIYGMLYLRCGLIVGCVFFALWSWSVKCYFDAVVWNLIFVFINLLYIFTSIFYLSPCKFHKEIEEVRNMKMYVWKNLASIFCRYTSPCFIHLKSVEGNSRKFWVVCAWFVLCTTKRFMLKKKLQKLTAYPLFCQESRYVLFILNIVLKQLLFQIGCFSRRKSSTYCFSSSIPRLARMVRCQH